MFALEKSEMYSGSLQTSATELFTKIISNVNIMLPTITVLSSIFSAWLVQNVALHMHTTQFSKFKQLHISLTPSKGEILYLKFAIYSNGSLKQLSKVSGVALWNISSENVFTIKIYYKSIPGGIFFGKVPCFQHILLNNIIRLTLKFENYSLKDILF